MATYLTDIRINRPSEIGGGAWFLSRLTDITIVLGKNSSGKSMLLRAWRNENVQDCHYVAPERTGELNWDPGQIQAQQTAERRSQQTPSNLAPSYRQQVLARITTYFAARGGQRAEGTAPSNPDDLEALLSLLLPDFAVRLLHNDTPPFELTRLPAGQKVTGVQGLSSGEAQLTTVALDIITIAAIWDLEARPRRILLVDEPDVHIHPDLQVRFADFLSRVAARFQLQVVIATHSTTLLAAFGQREDLTTSVIYLDRTDTNFQAIPLDQTRKQLAACLGGHVLMGPLFGAPLLLVEGDDDARIWGQVPRHNVVSLAVLPCGGDQIINYQRALEQILSCLSSIPAAPLGFALRDGDKSLPSPNPQNPQSYIRFVRLACKEAENLYLTEEVLRDIGTDWGAASQAIVAASPQYGQKAAILASAPSWDRRTQDIKAVIQEISTIIDPKKVHWALRVGHAIGSERPSGELLSFLGQDLVDSLWGQASPQA